MLEAMHVADPVWRAALVQKLLENIFYLFSPCRAVENGP